MFLLIIGKRVGDFFEFVLLSSLEKHVGYLHPREKANLCKIFCFHSGDGAKMTQIRLVAHHRYACVRFGVGSCLTSPS